MNFLSATFIFLLLTIPALIVSAMIFGSESDGIALSAIFLAALGTLLIHLKKVKAAESIIKAKQRTEDQLKEQSKIDKDFRANHQYVTTNGLAFIQIDEKQMQVRVGGYKEDGQQLPSRTFVIDQILGISVTENGKNVFGSDAGNTLGMAAVGGLMFGGAGAIVGAMAGQNAKSITDISVTLSLDDLSTPFVSLNLVTAPIPRGSEQHTSLAAEAKKWAGMLDILLSRHKKSLAGSKD